jgi:hypothetical protein
VNSHSSRSTCSIGALITVCWVNFMISPLSVPHY